MINNKHNEFLGSPWNSWKIQRKNGANKINRKQWGSERKNSEKKLFFGKSILFKKK